MAGLFIEIGPDGEPATRLRTLARHLPIVVWAVDPDGTVRSSFGQGMRRLGLHDGELDGTHISLWGNDGELTISRAMAGESVSFDAEGVFDDRPWAMRNFVVPAPGGGALAVSVDVTERYLVEKELGVSEGRFKVLAESAPVGIFLADTVGGNIYTNPTLQRQWGRPMEETLERRWIEAVHPDDRIQIENRRAASRERGVPFDMQYRIERPDGEERWLEVKARRVFDDSGEHVGYVGTTEDITDRRITEQALLASESRFRTIAESAPIGVFLSDTRTATTYTNPRFREIVGLEQPTEHELFGGPTFLDTLHPDDLPMVLEATQALLRDGEPFFLVSRVVEGDAVRWVQSHAVALVDDDGTIIGTVGTLSDVTDRHISEQRLRESEELTRAILETAAEGIVTFDEHGLIQTFNNAAQRIFRRSAQEAIGRSVGVLLPDPHRDVYLGYLRSFRDTGETPAGRLAAPRAAGSAQRRHDRTHRAGHHRGARPRPDHLHRAGARHLRAPGVRTPARAPGHPRPAHLAAQPGAPRRAARERPGAGLPPRELGGGAVRQPRPGQGGHRFARAPGRRRAAGGGRPSAPGGGAPDRHRHPLRRGRVRGAGRGPRTASPTRSTSPSTSSRRWTCPST